jgi:hypothetical protein
MKIGTFEVSFNRNTKVAYTNFKSSIEIFEKIECDDCDATNFEEKAKDLLSKWFLKVSAVEETDIFVYPIVIEKIDEKRFDDGQLKKLIYNLQIKDVS